MRECRLKISTIPWERSRIPLPAIPILKCMYICRHINFYGNSDHLHAETRWSCLQSGTPANGDEKIERCAFRENLRCRLFFTRSPTHLIKIIIIPETVKIITILIRGIFLHICQKLDIGSRFDVANHFFLFSNDFFSRPWSNRFVTWINCYWDSIIFGIPYYYDE